MQWQVAPKVGGTFSPHPQRHLPTLSTFTTSLTDTGKQYRAVFTNAGGTVTTNAAGLTVDVPPSVSNT